MMGDDSRQTDSLDDNIRIPETPAEKLSSITRVNEGSPVDLSRFVQEAKDLDSPDLSAPGNVSRKRVIDSDNEGTNLASPSATAVTTAAGATGDEETPVLNRRPAKNRRVLESSDDENYDDAYIAGKVSATSKAPDTARDNDLATLTDMFPNRPVAELEAILASHPDAQTAIDFIIAADDKAQQQPKKPAPGNAAAAKPKKKRAEEESEAEMTDEDGDPYEGMNKEKILQLFQECTESQMLRFPGCSEKRASILLSLRPFESFGDLVQKITDTKGLTTQILHNVQEMLDELAEVDRLMRKCERIAHKMRVRCRSVRTDKDDVMDGSGEDEEDANEPKETLVGQPESIQGTLKSYQLVGLNWLALLYKNEYGGILADEMGLGKTFQSIAFLAHVKSLGDPGPHLVICPASTVDNWVRELTRWCPSLRIASYFGTQGERETLRWRMKRSANSYDVVVTTYSTITSQPDRAFLRKVEFSVMVVDEGHMLKNMSAQRYGHLMAFQARHRFLLTGTPLQNNLLELMSLLNFIMPDMFRTNKETLSRIFSGNKYDVKEDDEFSSELDLVHRAQHIMRPFVLRRRKADVLQDLPKKQVEVMRCTMTESQAAMYSDLVNDFRQRKLGEDGNKQLQNIMMQLRKAANHPLLHRTLYTTETLQQMSKAIMREPEYFDANQQYIFEDMEVMSDFELHKLCRKFKSLKKFRLSKDVVFASAKLDYLRQILPAMHENLYFGTNLTMSLQGDRILIFSQFTVVLDILGMFLKKLGYQHIRLDGQTPVSERQQLIDAFQENDDVFVFLLSTKAGGVGINLTAANVVILHDIDFNPHNDKQAEDRAHRVGQTRDVRVIKMVTDKTLEIAMLERANQKLDLEQQITKSGEEDDVDTNDVKYILQQSLDMQI